MNGCTSSTSVQVLENTDIPYATISSIVDPSCFGDSDGFITIEQVLGGTAPYVYALNNQTFTSNTIFNNLGPGNYDLTIEDANGCTLDTSFVVSSPELN